MNLPAFSSYGEAEVLDATVVATDQALVRVRPPDGFVSAHAHPGQFCQVRVDGAPGIFAMASEPGRTPVEFLVRTGAGDGNEAADRLARARGRTFEMSLPAGDGFGLPDEADGVLFVATGTGVAPVCAAIEASQGRGHTLIHGVRSPAHVAIGEHVERWRRRGVSTRLCFSRTDAAGALSGETVQEVLAAEHPDLRDATLVAVGQPDMVDSLRVLCGQLGLPPSRFLTNL